MLARRNGTYYGPGFPAGGDESPTAARRGAAGSGSTPSHPLPADGVVFVDTTDGHHADPHASTFPTLAGVRLGAGALAPPAEAFRAGSSSTARLEITAGVAMRGLVYALDSLTYQARRR